MKSILMSIQPKWCGKIINGEKTIEVRKTAPKEVPFKVYIYCTEGGQILREAFYPNGKPDKKYFYLADRNRNHEKNLNGKVIGEFVCDYVEKEAVAFTEICNFGRLYHCRLSLAELKKYAGKRTSLYYWHISALKVYDKPRELVEFRYLTPSPCCKTKWGEYCVGGFYDKCKYIDFYRCTNRITRPPQSWQYVGEIEE